MLETVGLYWEYAVLLPVAYIVKMTISNNKSIQEMKEAIARDLVTDTELEKHEQRMKEYIHDFKRDVIRIEEKLDHLILHVQK